MSAIAAARSSATRSPACSPVAGYAGDARVLHQRRRRAGRRARPLGLSSATARRSARTSAPIPEGLYPGDYLKPVGAALVARSRRASPRHERGRVAADRPARRRRRDDGDDPGRPGDAQCRARRLLLGAVADRGRARRVAEAIDCAGGKGLDLSGHACRRRRGSCRRIGRIASRRSSAPPNSATTSTGR